MENLNKIVQILKETKFLIITAGAGMGVDSGLPDFRGKDGFWKNYKAFENKFSFMQCANPQFLYDHPNLFWGFYGHRLNLYRKTKPHEGFKIIQDLIKRNISLKDYFILTSNVDGHFQKSGFEESKIYEFHGSINIFQCEICLELFDSEGIEIIVDEKNFSASQPHPDCPHCKKAGLVRPNILMFQDYSFNSKRVNQQAQRYEKFYSQIQQNDQVTVLEMGAGNAIQTTRNMGEDILFDKNLNQASLIRINPTDYQNPLGFTEKFQKRNPGKLFFPIQLGSLEALKIIQNQVLQDSNNK